MSFFKGISDRVSRRLFWCLLAAGALALVAGIVIFVLTGDSGYTVTTFSMGSYVQQTVYGGNREEGARAAASAVAELENLISWRVGNSDTARLNEEAGRELIKIDPRTEQVRSSALAVCGASGGAFDITIAPVSRLWDFDENPHLPDSTLIEKFRDKVDFSGVALPGDGMAALRYHEMALDLGAVGKGAACDAAVEAYRESGVDRAVVAVGGSVGVYGEKPFGADWVIAVRDPAGGSLGTLKLQQGFVSTSGSYEKCFTEQGKTYHHLLDPATGYPAESGLVSVTVKSAEGVLSDGLSTACFVLGLKKSLPVLAEFQAEAIFVTDRQVYVTKGLWEDFSMVAEGYELEKLE